MTVAVTTKDENVYFSKENCLENIEWMAGWRGFEKPKKEQI
jgi:hypothetical protein